MLERRAKVPNVFTRAAPARHRSPGCAHGTQTQGEQHRQDGRVARRSTMSGWPMERRAGRGSLASTLSTPGRCWAEMCDVVWRQCNGVDLAEQPGVAPAARRLLVQGVDVGLSCRCTNSTELSRRTMAIGLESSEHREHLAPRHVAALSVILSVLWRILSRLKPEPGRR